MTTSTDFDAMERANRERAGTLRHLLRSRRLPAVSRGYISPDAVPIVMCLWNRPERLPVMLELIAAQTTDLPVRLMLWNNNVSHRAEYEEAVARAPLGPRQSVELFESPDNIGGIARFVVARWLRESGLSGPFIMLDDDLDVREDFVDHLVGEYLPEQISAWWAFTNRGSHWERDELESGAVATYTGTGGTITDLAIVDDPAFFDIPDRYFMLEDQWMTHRAKKRGWALRKSGVDITQVPEELARNQSLLMLPLKDEFFHFLHR